MELFKEAGGNCIATYIPWLIHEPTEGQIIFGGEDGVLDFEGFLDVACQVGLNVIARPGPYQYSELVCNGLPRWLCDNYPEIQARTIDGKSIDPGSVSYVHPLFLEKVRSWFDVVCPIIARHTISRGGPISFTQFDNEMTGIHIWAGSLDYNAVSMGFGLPGGRYARFLRERHGDIGQLNRLYHTSFNGFEDVRPLVAVGAPDASAIRRSKDYFDFYLHTVGEYASFLVKMMREHGIDTPLIHNAANPKMNPYFLETIEALDDTFLLGSDHYYNLGQDWPQNNPTPQYAVKVFSSNEMLRLMGFPPTVLELPGGSASDWPPITPHDSMACAMANIALGMKGSNYYIFTGGPNPPGAGINTDLYDYGAAIGADGEIRPLYSVQKQIGMFVRENAWLVEAEREHDCRVALDFEHTRSHAYWPKGDSFPFSNDAAWEFLQKGVLTTAFCASLSPSLIDLRTDAWVADILTPIIVAASVSMGRAKQERLVRFLQNGGRILIGPVLPHLDEYLEPCTILAEALGAPSVVASAGGTVRATIGPVANISHDSAFFSDTLPAGSEILGMDERSGKTIAWMYSPNGQGNAIFLGISWTHARREQEHMLLLLMKKLGLRQKVFCSNPNVWTSLRTAGSNSMLFILNLFSSPMEATIECDFGDSVKLIHTGYHALGPMSVKTVDLSAPE